MEPQNFGAQEFASHILELQNPILELQNLGALSRTDLSQEIVDHGFMHHEPMMRGIMNAGNTDHAFVIYEKR